MNDFLKISTFIVISTLSCSASSKSDSLIDGTLCLKSEDVYFSCGIAGSKKIASICAAGNTSPFNGYVQYRYGNSQGLDLVYPKNKAASADLFKMTDLSEGTFTGAHVKFSIGNYQYVVFSTGSSGIYVVADGKKIYDRSCNSSRYKMFSIGAYEGIGKEDVGGIDQYDY